MSSPEEWNDFAATYDQVQRESRLPIQQDVVDYLSTVLPLAQMTATDLAAGTGRYALPLAQRCRSVELIDWAPAMLQYADKWLKEHQRTNYTLTAADWRQLANTQRADLVFVSQLPDLGPADLPQLLAMSRRALVFNLQTQADHSLLAKMAQQLNVPVPTEPQYDPRRATQLRQALTDRHLAYRSRQFTYQLTDQASVSDLLAAFDRPFSVRQANALAAQVIGQPQANQLVAVKRTYTFELLLIPTGQTKSRS